MHVCTHTCTYTRAAYIQYYTPTLINKVTLVQYKHTHKQALMQTLICSYYTYTYILTHAQKNKNTSSLTHAHTHKHYYLIPRK